MIDAHHHLWDLSAVHYPWLMAKGTSRFFGDPASIQRNYLLEEFRRDATAQGVTGSVHVQVGAEDGWAEAQWVQSVADANPDWPMVQVVFCDLTAPDLGHQLDRFQTLSTLRGARQIVGRAPGEDAMTGTNTLLDNPRFADGLRELGRRGLSFDLQLIPELMENTARVLETAPDTQIALCHAGSPHDRSATGLADWAQALRHLSALPHVTCKLSGLGMFKHDWRPEDLRPIIEVCLDQFGPDRCMFGSNFPVDSLYSDYETLFSAHALLVPKTDHEQVFETVSRRFYRLDG
ncbi:Predicted metal-dependent hydrolase, TIM-barrel fold [Aliiroseovarius sediminilitoris]|uniref:Predicted metal-dependent hydrolase, TIM-barrel fold n=1 Tax=Aliiroseovarius sediminilitoris TaxID=1173584 RepID=A0A1I0R635_9RHOB|nr:amidohydrolase family protein [Aliiroseovarius sediminilitoris]SEW35499.1 Predicted metal-dependent hydrolase, TIM-barrel fold [Aliiroseovarius sediminilitoris]